MVRNKAHPHPSSTSSSGASSTKSPNKQSNLIRTHRKSSSISNISDDNIVATTTTTSSATATTITTPTQSAFSSVHKQNLYIVAFPLIFLFNILRSLIYQLFCIFRYLYGASTKIIYRKSDTKIKVITSNNSQIGRALNNSTDIAIESREKDILVQTTNNSTTTTIYPIISTPQRVRNSEVFKSTMSPPGPGDPLLAKQKHHHRRAFEYISKALKIDEENEGEIIIYF